MIDSRKSALTAGALLCAMAAAPASAVTVASYTFADTDLVDTVLSWDLGANPSTAGFQSYDSGGAAVSESIFTTRITDQDGATWIAGVNGDETMDLRFSQTSVINGDGADIAVFMVGQTTSVNVALVDHPGTSTILYSGAYTGTDYLYNGVTYGLEVALIDLTDFGLAAGATLGDLRLDFYDAVSLVGALNTTVIPVPAAVWLFGSGLVALVGMARRKSQL